MKFSILSILILLTSTFAFAEGFRAWQSVDGQMLCFPSDANEVAYGGAVANNYCTVGYRSAVDIYGKVPRCFPEDKFGVVFGQSLPDTYCSVGYRTANDIYGIRRCFNVDKNGNVYGLSIADVYCN